MSALSMTRRSVAFGALGSIVVVASVASANVDLWLRLDGIEGDPEYPGPGDAYADWIEVFAFRLAVARDPDAGPNAPPTWEFVITKELDNSTIPLYDAAAAGTTIPTAGFVALQYYSEPYKMLKVALEDVVVTSVTSLGATDHEKHQDMSEEITLSFSNIEIEYLDSPEDTPEPADKFVWGVGGPGP